VEKIPLISSYQVFGIIGEGADKIQTQYSKMTQYWFESEIRELASFHADGEINR